MFILAGAILFIHFGWSYFIHYDRSTFHEVWSIIFSWVAVSIGLQSGVLSENLGWGARSAFQNLCPIEDQNLWS